MEMIVGYLLIIVGVGMEIISVLAWLGILKPASEGAALKSVTFWDVLLEFIINSLIISSFITIKNI